MSNNVSEKLVNVCEFRKSLNSNFFSVLDSIFNELNNLIIYYHKDNDNKISELFSLLEESIYECDDYKLKFLLVRCGELKENIKKRRKKFLVKINTILDNFSYENSEKYRFNTMNFLNYLIHEDRNIGRLKIFLNNLGKSFFSSTFYDNIIETVLYCFDIEDDANKNYYYKVSIMLFDKISNTLLSKNRSKYLSILDDLLFKGEYVSDLKKILNNEVIDSSVLASRFNVSFDFPYEYDDVNIIINDFDVPNLKQPAITIDNEHTSKRDDAIYFKKNKDDTYTLYAHVGYVPALVSYDSIINEVARERGKNVSFLNRIIPIYPCEMVLDNFSLDKGMFKPTVTYSLKVSKEFKIIPDTLKITRTNVKVSDNYSYNGINNIVMENRDSDFGDMLKYLTILTMNNIDNFDLDVERLLKDKLFYEQFLVDNGNRNIAQEIIQYIMRTVNHNSAKYFRDREIPCLYKWAFIDSSGLDKLSEEISHNSIVQKNKKLINELNCTFLEVKLSEIPRRFFEWECYSSFTSPLRKYSASYNQFMMDKFVFDKNFDAYLKDEWYNNTKVLAEELNYRKKMRREMEAVDRKLLRIRRKI